MSHFLLRHIGVATTLALIAGPVVYAYQAKAHTRNLRVVREGVLYRSAQLTLPGLKRTLHEHGIRTVVSLRDSDRPADVAEETFCREAEVNFFRLPPLSWDAINGTAPVEENLRKFRAILNDRGNYPILVHCFAGIHRTGAYVAVYRMDREGWSNERAIAEMRACGYDTLDGDLDILGFLTNYKPVCP